MITLKELLMGRIDFKNLPKEHQGNIMLLLERINKVRSAYKKPMTVNDGYRLPKNTPKHGAAKSKHLEGLAVDIDDDEKGTLWFWLMKDKQMQMLKDVGLWLEHGNYTHNKKYGTWVHFQCSAPRSGNRIFIPSSEPDPNPSFWNGVYDKKYN